MAGVPDPHEGKDWCGWARYSHRIGSKWHRVVEAPSDGDGRPTGYVSLCGSRVAPMAPTTDVQDYRWSPPDPCRQCWPVGVDHPGIASDLPPRRDPWP